MKLHINRAALALILTFMLLITAEALSEYLEPDVEYVPNSIVVAFKLENLPITATIVNGSVVTGIAEVDNLNRVFGVTYMWPLFPKAEDHGAPEMSGYYSLTLRDGLNLEYVLAAYDDLGSVEHVEPVGIHRESLFYPNDPYRVYQWGLGKIDAYEAWDINQGDPSIPLAIIDTGIKWNHPDLNDDIWINAADPINGIDDDGNGYVDDYRGWDWVTDISDCWPGEDCTTPDNDPMDFHGHGTHVGGIAAAETNNNIGIAGIGFDCKMMALRVGWRDSDGNGWARADFSASAFYYAADKGAKALNYSFRSSNSGGLDVAAIYARNHGVIIVTSAGNLNNQTPDYLSTLSYVISVAASDQTDHKADFSNYGTWVDVCAPGVDIYSTYNLSYPNNYLYASGTSMSAPFVTGLVGLIRSAAPSMSRAEVQSLIINTADNIDALNPGYEGLLGSGRINAYSALIAIQGSISGVVTEASSGNFIQGVAVEAIGSGVNDITDFYGEYELAGLEEGTYDVFFSHPDYYDTTIYGITVNSNDTTTLDVMLQPLPEADVGVSAILSPPDSIQFDLPYTLKSEITNYGLNSQTFNVIFEVHVSGSPNIEIADTVMITNMPGTSIDTVTFSDDLIPAFGTNYDLISYTALVDDQNNSNDTSASTSFNYGGMKVWYGNLSDSPIFGFVNQRVGIDVYVQTSENTYVADMHLCLGSDDQYFDSLLSDTEGALYYPLTEWDDASFREPQGSPPNPAGWSSQSFLGWADLFGDPNPWLHFETPTRVLRFIVKTVDDMLLIGDTVQCFGPGINTPNGGSWTGDTLGRINYPIVEQFSPLLFVEAGDCYYVPGDINGDGSTMGNDVTYGVRYFKGIGPSPPDSCWNEMSGSWLYSAGDANGNCEFTGSDITYLVAYFKSIQPSILWCIWTPPANPLLLENRGDLTPLIFPGDTDNNKQR